MKSNILLTRKKTRRSTRKNVGRTDVISRDFASFRNMSYIKKISVSLFQAPLVQSFRTALGDHDILENVLFVIEIDDGTKGYGEAAIAGHITGETIEGTMRNLKSLEKMLLGSKPKQYLYISKQLHERCEKNKSAVAAVETALLDALTRQAGIPLWRLFGRRPQHLTTDITIVIADLAETQRTVKKFYNQGFRIFKIKVGRDPDLDYQRVLAVHRLAPRCKIYLDANQGYSAQQTLNFLQQLKRTGIRPALIEQPVPREDWEGLKEVTRLSQIPICADESVQSLADAIRLIKEKAAQAINIKLMKFGLIQSLKIAKLAQANKIKLMIGGMMETSLAMTTSAHLAAGLGGFHYIDLDTPFFIDPKFDKNPYLSRRGVYDLSKVKTGVGIIPFLHAA